MVPPQAPGDDIGRRLDPALEHFAGIRTDLSPAVLGAVRDSLNQRRAEAAPTVDDVGVGADRAGVAGSSRPVPDDAGHCARAASRLSRRAFLVAENVAGYVRNTPRLIRVTGWCICPANRCSARLRPAEWRLSVSSRGVGVVE